MTPGESHGALMRWVGLLVLALPAAAGPRPVPEELAAMLLSPSEAVRVQARELLKPGTPAETEALRIVARRAPDRAGWIRALEKRAKGARGAELERVQRMLDFLRDSADAHIGVDLHLVTVPPDVAKKILDGAEAVVHGPRSAAWKRWWMWIRRDKRTTEVLHRGLAGRDTRPVLIKAVKQVTYVKDVRIVGKKLEHVVAKVEPGLTIRWTPRLSGDGASVTLDLDVKLVDLERPIEVKVEQRAGHSVRLQKPRTTVYALRRTTTLSVRGYAAVRFPVDDSGPVVILIVRANLGAPLPLRAPPRASGDSDGLR